MTIEPLAATQVVKAPSVMAHVIKLQLAVAIMLTLLTWRMHPVGVKSLAYGELVSLVGAIWLWRRARGLARIDRQDAQASLRFMQITSAGRFVLAAGLLALPLVNRQAWHAGWLAGGFIAGQMVAIVATAWAQMSSDRIPTQD